MCPTLCAVAAAVASMLPNSVSPDLIGTRYEFVIHVQTPQQAGPDARPNNQTLFPSEIPGKMWSAGGLVRLEVNMGGNRNRVQILTPTVLYTLMSSTKRGRKLALTEQAKHTMLALGSPFALATPSRIQTVWPGAKKVGMETVRGVKCDVWRASVPGRSPSTVKVWMTRAKNQVPPVRMEITTHVRRVSAPSGIGTSESMRRTVEVIRVAERAEIPASMFVVPQDYKITEARPVPAAGKREKQNKAHSRPGI